MEHLSDLKKLLGDCKDKLFDLDSKISDQAIIQEKSKKRGVVVFNLECLKLQCIKDQRAMLNEICRDFEDFINQLNNKKTLTKIKEVEVYFLNKKIS